MFMVRRIDDLVLGPRQVNRDPGLGIPYMQRWPWDGHYKNILLPAD
jgi:hypothetical protein